METESSINFLGALANGLSIIVKEHGPSKLVFEKIKSELKRFGALLNEKAPGEVDIIHTGSSFDDLHLCIFLGSLQGKQAFFPETDFDICAVYNTFPVEDYTRIDMSQDRRILNDKLKNSKHAAVMVPSLNEGYIKLLVTETGKNIVARPKCTIGEFIDSHGYIHNNLFNNEWIQTETDEMEILYKRCVSVKKEANKSSGSQTGDTGYTNRYKKGSLSEYIISGPALTSLKPTEYGYTYDFVQSFPCEKWPSVADRWCKRPRDAKWPNEELIQDIMKDGCIVVPVGFYTSDEKCIEWRLSFNLAERKLSLALSRNQRTCYCIVKLMLKSELSKSAVLTSYMVKNMMFWFCEQQYGSEEWPDDCLGKRIMQLIDYICLALENHNIPQYFLPKNNLIGHRSSKEVGTTLSEIQAIKTKPMEAMVTICRKLQCFETQVIMSTTKMNETRNALILYLAIVQSLYQKGMMDVLATTVATHCFKAIIDLNRASQFMALNRSQLVASFSVPALLRPTAIYYMKTGKFDEAIALFQIMLSCDADIVKKDYPETWTNLGCLYANKMELALAEQDKKQLGTKADRYFKEDLKHIHNSPSLHLAYGNFLKDNKMGVLKAVEQFKLAVNLNKTRSDDDACIQIAVPGKKRVEQVPGKVVAYYLLVTMLTELDDIYEARRYAAKLDALIATLPLDHRRCGYEFCALSYNVSRLTVKAHLTQDEIKKKTVLNKT